MTLRPGPLRLSLDNQDRRAGAAVGLHRGRCASSLWIGKRNAVPDRQADADQPDLPRRLQGRHLNIDQRLKITSLDVLFTDSKGSPRYMSGSAISSRSIWFARISMHCWKSFRRRKAPS